MCFRALAARSFAVVLSLLLPASAALAQTSPRVHAGTIVDALSSQPIEAEAFAYRTRDLGATGECPEHGDRLDRQTSDQDGAFALRIDVGVSQYVAVYCAEGYVPREQLENDNSAEALRVVPDPVRLLPAAPRLQKENLSSSDALQQAIAEVLEEVSERLRQLFAADRQSFETAFRQLLPPDQRLVAIVIGRSAGGRGRGNAANQADAERGALPAIAQALNAATMHLRYFAAATGAGFFPALKLFRGENQEIVELLRNRAISRIAPGA